MEDLFVKNQIRTFSGIYINVITPTAEQIEIKDIAHALSQQCRFAGHLPAFYSVAQHSVLCSYLVEPEWQLQALMHDASEAYLLDIPSPIKPNLTNYKTLEDNLMKVIASKYGFEYPLSNEVKAADRAMLIQEWDELVLGRVDDFGLYVWDMPHAEEMFITRFKTLIERQ